MSFYSYKNSRSTHCPCSVGPNDVLSGLNEKVCIQVQRVYDSCLMQDQLDYDYIFIILINNLKKYNNFYTQNHYL